MCSLGSAYVETRSPAPWAVPQRMSSCFASVSSRAGNRKKNCNRCRENGPIVHVHCQRYCRGRHGLKEQRRSPLKSLKVEQREVIFFLNCSSLYLKDLFENQRILSKCRVVAEGCITFICIRSAHQTRVPKYNVYRPPFKLSMWFYHIPRFSESEHKKSIIVQWN
jgi:hypothetical protein